MLSMFIVLLYNKTLLKPSDQLLFSWVFVVDNMVSEIYSASEMIQTIQSCVLQHKRWLIHLSFSFASQSCAA